MPTGNVRYVETTAIRPTPDTGYTKICMLCFKRRLANEPSLIGKERELTMGVCEHCKVHYKPPKKKKYGY